MPVVEGGDVPVVGEAAPPVVDGGGLLVILVRSSSEVSGAAVAIRVASPSIGGAVVPLAGPLVLMRVRSASSSAADSGDPLVDGVSSGVNTPCR